jgi:hypothetical protein
MTAMLVAPSLRDGFTTVTPYLRVPGFLPVLRRGPRRSRRLTVARR